MGWSNLTNGALLAAAGWMAAMGLPSSLGEVIVLLCIMSFGTTILNAAIPNVIVCASPPERTGEAIDQSGWMHTGDLATLDAEGYCSITGRLKDMLIRGGENVYPREIEEFLYGHPKIQTAQVFGVPDPRYGEEVCAWVILIGGRDRSP